MKKAGDSGDEDQSFFKGFRVSKFPLAIPVGIAEASISRFCGFSKINLAIPTGIARFILSEKSYLAPRSGKILVF